MTSRIWRRLTAVSTVAILVLSIFLLWAEPVWGQPADVDQTDGMAYVECDDTRPTTTTTGVETTTTRADTTTTAVETTTTVEDEVLPTEVTTTTIADEVLPTEVTSPSSVVASTLPFTGAPTENLSLLAMTLLGLGLLVLVGSKGARAARGRHVRR